MTRLKKALPNLIYKPPMDLIEKLFLLFGLKNIDDTNLIYPYTCIAKYNLIEKYQQILVLFYPYFVFHCRYINYAKKISFYKAINLLDKSIQYYGYKVIKNIVSTNSDKIVSYYIQQPKKKYRIKFDPIIEFDCPY